MSLPALFIWTFLAQRLKCLPAVRETWARSLGEEDPLEKEMATHSSILAWRIPWMEEPGGLQSTGSQSRTRLSDLSFTFTFLVNRVMKKCRPNLSTSQPSGEVTFSSKQWNHRFQHWLGFGQLPCYVQTRVVPWSKSGLFFQLELCKSFFKKKKKLTAQKLQEWSFMNTTWIKPSPKSLWQKVKRN